MLKDDIDRMKASVKAKDSDKLIEQSEKLARDIFTITNVNGEEFFKLLYASTFLHFHLIELEERGINPPCLR